MFEWFKTVWQKKYAFIGFALVIALIPFAVVAEPEALSKTIAVTLGVEQIESGIQITVEHVIFDFEPGNRPRREIITATGESLDTAVKNMGLDRGRDVSLSHCTAIIISDNLDELRNDILWSLYRRRDLSGSVSVFQTSNGIGAVMQQSIDDGDGRSGLIQQMARHRMDHGRDHTFDNLLGIVRNIRENRNVRIATISLNDGKLTIPPAP